MLIKDLLLPVCILHKFASLTIRMCDSHHLCLFADFPTPCSYELVDLLCPSAKSQFYPVIKNFSEMGLWPEMPFYLGRKIMK